MLCLEPQLQLIIHYHFNNIIYLKLVIISNIRIYQNTNIVFNYL